MGLLNFMEKRHSNRVVAALKSMLPEQKPQVMEIPCHLTIEKHTGIRVGTTDGGVILLHRCQLHWWVRFIESPNIPGLKSSLVNSIIIGHESFPFMPANTRPAQAATTIAASLMDD